MKKILLSLLTISAVAAVAFYGTRAFFSDVETSKDNVMTAGSVDLKVSNTSYATDPVTGDFVSSGTTTWDSKDLTEEKFLNFSDVKPGDYGEDTIDLTVIDNDAWVCADLTLTSNDDNTCTEPESDDDSTCALNQDPWDGDLAQGINLVWWADDGDNVLEVDEEASKYYLGPDSIKELLGDDNKLELTLADAYLNFFDRTRVDQQDEVLPMRGSETYYIGKGWCFGDMELNPVEQDGLTTGNPVDRGTGFTCNGAGVNNAGQTDSLTADLTFTAVQARHNMQYLCPEHRPKAFVLTDASEQNALNAVSQYKPWYEHEINGLCVDFTLHNPTASPAWFDTQRDGALGTFIPGLSDINITEGPLNGTQVGNLYDDDITVPAGGTLSVQKCATNEIRFGIHYGAEQLWYLDWATFTAQSQ